MMAKLVQKLPRMFIEGLENRNAQILLNLSLAILVVFGEVNAASETRHEGGEL